MKVPELIITRLASESIGSPYLMQEFCRQICTLKTPVENRTFEEILHTTADDLIGRPIFEKLSRGPRSRKNRKLRRLNNGEAVDVYKLILLSMAYLKPGLVTLDYGALHKAMQEICIPDDTPAIQEVGRALKQMAKISATDQSSTKVIDLDEDEQKLHIADPFFAFYLRWGTFTIRYHLNHVPLDGADTPYAAIIPPSAVHRVELGEYENESLIPQWEVKHNSEDITWSEGRILMQDKAIRLHFLFQNSGTKPVSVQIQAVE